MQAKDWDIPLMLSEFASVDVNTANLFINLQDDGYSLAAIAKLNKLEVLLDIEQLREIMRNLDEIKYVI